MRLSRSCLPIGHDDSIEAIEYVVNHRRRQQSISLILARLQVEYMVILEFFQVEARPDQDYLRVIVRVLSLHTLDSAFLAQLILTLQEGTHTNHH